MFWIYVAEALLVISMIVGFLTLLLMAMEERASERFGPWTILWRGGIFIVLPIYAICLFQVPNATSSWAGPRVALQLINIFALICAFCGAACLTFMHGRSHNWLGHKSSIVKVAVPFAICLWAEGVASAIPYMVRASAHDLGWAEFNLPATLSADAAAIAAIEVARLNHRRQLCETAVAQIPKGPVELPLIDVSKTPRSASGQFAISLPSIADPQTSPFELFYVTSPSRRDLGPVTRWGVVFYAKDRKSWCNIDESGTHDWYGRGGVSSVELRRLFIWAVGKAAQDARYWRDRRTHPLDWAAIGVLQEVGYDTLKIEPRDSRAEVLDRVLFWFKKLIQAAIVAMLAKGLSDAFKSENPPPTQQIDNRSV